LTSPVPLRRVTSRWFSQEGPFVKTHCAVESGSEFWPVETPC
jgi:hypothetical protein